MGRAPWGLCRQTGVMRYGPRWFHGVRPQTGVPLFDRGKAVGADSVSGDMKLWSVVAFFAAVGLAGTACGAAPSSPESSSEGQTTPSGVEPSGKPVDTTTSLPKTAGVEEPARPPDVDLSVHSVPLDEVYFDTFDGGSVPLSDSTPELRERLLDVIPPIDRPVYGDVSSGDWLDPSDPVLGYVAGDQAYAYPFKILNFHEIVNDDLDGLPVLISYCPLCRSAIVYDRRVGGDVLSFGNTSALYESDLVMVDRSTGSYWWQVAGTAIVGPLTGARLEPLPSAVATWADWASQYPETLVLTRDTGYSRPYERDAFADYAEIVDSGRFAFPVGEAARDPRLQPSALVVGVVLAEATRAYPVDNLTDPINDEVGGEPIVVFPTDGGATVFSAVVNGETLLFQSSDAGVVDAKTGSVWTSAGVAVSGSYEGTALRPIPSRTTFWFAFVGAFPDVQVHTG